ncbi:probable BOI-related E3 ubiquitin-protein ligase 3 [Rutidosis leptorrhynchoides]|uniref:probable BOI-related E3 ubiquitin-protein ligase 3 n=1 Tax=Rutidosis leptorrhynchoides TaxID=125765 RepID=UPI003A99F2C9
MEKVRLEMEVTRRRNTIRLIAAVEEEMKKKLRSKEEEINKMGRLNYALEEKVKSLNVENQLWQQMAETNEATANVLRQNLQQVLSQNQQQFENDDVESCCGSNYNKEKDQEEFLAIKGEGINNNGRRLCRNCGESVSSVLLLPCRHLCICSVCQSFINFCPVCKSAKNASLHVNIS